LISADKNSFFNMREIKEKVLAELTRTGIWEKVLTSVRRGRYTIGSTLHHTFLLPQNHRHAFMFLTYD
jgi:hypothetical protein